MRYTIIGLPAHLDRPLPPAALRAIDTATVFAGGVRHHHIVASLLPDDARWIDITPPLDRLWDTLARYDAVIFASGDPWFYGMASSLQARFPDADITVYPSFNSLQQLAHAAAIPYGPMHAVSLTGRPWQELDQALINGESLIGILTDRSHTPVSIMRRMHQYGYDNYSVTVGENIGNPDRQRITLWHPTDTPQADFDMPNCMILQRTAVRRHPLGIPDDRFMTLDGRPGMITKRAIRLADLSLLGLDSCTTLWDIGFCTGSVSIEARLQFPSLQVVAFERRLECLDIIHHNMQSLGAPGIIALTGDFPACVTDDLPRPQAAFIGGHNGQLHDIVRYLDSVMDDGAAIVFNSVSDHSRQLFADSIADSAFTLTDSLTITIDSHNPITILRACKHPS